MSSCISYTVYMLIEYVNSSIPGILPLPYDMIYLVDYRLVSLPSIIYIYLSVFVIYACASQREAVGRGRELSE